MFILNKKKGRKQGNHNVIIIIIISFTYQYLKISRISGYNFVMHILSSNWLVLIWAAYEQFCV